MKRSTAVIAGLTALLAPLTAAAQGADDIKNAAKLFEIFRFSGLVPALLVLTVAVIVLRGAKSLTDRLGRRFTERRLLAQQVATILRFVVYIVTFVLVIRSVFRLDQQTMLALTGTIAVSVGFALKDLAASVLAGMIILFDRPFQVGDRVTFGGNYGEISTIGLRSVRMVTLDDSLVTIPNNKFLTDVVISGNAGALDMQIVVDFFIAPDADVDLARRIVTEAMRTSRFVYLEKPVVVLVNEVIHESYVATRLRAKAYVLDVQQEKAYETDVSLKVKRAFAAAGIRAPAVVLRWDEPEKTVRGKPAATGEAR